MPLYEYECLQCERRSEVIQRFDDPPLTICAHCGGALRKVLSAPAVQFKGTGWYVTDYAGKGKADKEREAEKGAAKAEGEGKPTGEKAEKAETKKGKVAASAAAKAGED